jgi:hypothetical protein
MTSMGIFNYYDWNSGFADVLSTPVSVVLDEANTVEGRLLKNCFLLNRLPIFDLQI